MRNNFKHEFKLIMVLLAQNDTISQSFFQVRWTFTNVFSQQLVDPTSYFCLDRWVVFCAHLQDKMGVLYNNIIHLHKKDNKKIQTKYSKAQTLKWVQIPYVYLTQCSYVITNQFLLQRMNYNRNVQCDIHKISDSVYNCIIINLYQTRCNIVQFMNEHAIVNIRYCVLFRSTWVYRRGGCC